MLQSAVDLKESERVRIGVVVGGGAAAVSAAADKALDGHKKAMGDVLDDYLQLRLVAMEEKVHTLISLLLNDASY